MHFGDVSEMNGQETGSDHVTRNVSATRSNEDWEWMFIGHIATGNVYHKTLTSSPVCFSLALEMGREKEHHE